MAVLTELLANPLTYVAFIVGFLTYTYLSDPLGINWVSTTTQHVARPLLM